MCSYIICVQMEDGEELKKREKSAAKYAEDFKAEYWSTSSKTGNIYSGTSLFQTLTVQKIVS